MANERLIFDNLDDIGDYAFDNDIDYTIKEYVNEAIDSIDGASANIFSSSEYVNLEKDLYKKNTYSLFEFDKLSINLVDNRSSSASLYGYFKVLESNSTYQLTTNESILIEGLHFAIEGDDGIKEKTGLVTITNPDNNGKHFIIKTPADKITYFYGKFIPASATAGILKVKLEIGSKASPWTPSINDISNANKENSERINTLKNSYYKFITTTLNDGIIKIAEAKSIESHINIINGTVANIKASYENIKESPYIINTDEKRALVRGYDKLINSQSRLIEVIGDVINNNKITPTGKDIVNVTFDEFNNSIYEYQKEYEKVKSLIDIKTRVYNTESNDSIVYKLTISSTNGSIFRNKYSNTTLTGVLFKNNESVADDTEGLKFKWSRNSGNRDADLFWEKSNYVNGEYLYLTPQDVNEMSVFTCEATINGVIVSDSYELNCLFTDDGGEEERGSVTFFSKPSEYKKGDRWILISDTRLLNNFYKKGQALEAVYATGNDSDWRLLIFADETDGVNLIRNYSFKERIIFDSYTSKTTTIPNWENTPKEAIVVLEDEIPINYYNTSINVIGDEYGANYVITSENDEVIILDE